MFSFAARSRVKRVSAMGTPYTPPAGLPGLGRDAVSDRIGSQSCTRPTSMGWVRPFWVEYCSPHAFWGWSRPAVGVWWRAETLFQTLLYALPVGMDVLEHSPLGEV